MIRYECDYSIKRGGAIPDTGEIIDAGTIRIKFDYPMTTPKVVEVTRPEWRVSDFVAEVAAQYRLIYKEEKETNTIKLGPPGCLTNPIQTNGKYGIWGHGIGDLYLEGFEKGDDGVYELHIGS